MADESSYKRRDKKPLQGKMQNKVKHNEMGKCNAEKNMLYQTKMFGVSSWRLLKKSTKEWQDENLQRTLLWNLPSSRFPECLTEDLAWAETTAAMHRFWVVICIASMDLMGDVFHLESETSQILSSLSFPMSLSHKQWNMGMWGHNNTLFQKIVSEKCVVSNFTASQERVTLSSLAVDGVRRV